MKEISEVLLLQDNVEAATMIQDGTNIYNFNCIVYFNQKTDELIEMMLQDKVDSKIKVNITFSKQK